MYGLVTFQFKLIKNKTPEMYTQRNPLRSILLYQNMFTDFLYIFKLFHKLAPPLKLHCYNPAPHLLPLVHYGASLLTSVFGADDYAEGGECDLQCL